MKFAKILGAVFLIALSTTPYRVWAEDAEKHVDLERFLRIMDVFTAPDDVISKASFDYSIEMIRANPG